VVTGRIASLQVRVNADGTLVADGAALADLAAVRVDGEMELTGNEEIGSLDGGGTVSLGAFTLTTGGNDTNTSFSGDMTGTGGLVKTGTGTMTLTGANSFDGSTTVNEGVLAVTGANGSLDSTSIFVTDTGTLTADGNALSFGAAVTVEDTGTFTLTGFESYTSLTQEGGTVNGGGVHTLSGAFTQNGGTTGGTVGITAGSVTQNGGTIASGTLVTSGGAKTLDGGTINGTLSGSGVTTVQTGTTNLDGSIVGGETRIATGGVLNLTGDSEVTTLVLTGGELTASADATLTGSGVGVFGEGESGTISAADGVTLTLASTFFVRGAGLPVGAPDTTVTFGSEGNEGTVVIATTAFGRVGDNSSVVIAEGTVMVGSTQAGQSAFSNDIFLATGVTTTVDATLDLNGFNTSVSNLSGEGEITNSDAAAAVLTLQNDQQSTFDGVIADGTGAISVVKVQGSRQILTADQAYTGTTTVNAGILQAGDGGTAGSFGAGTIILNAPGTATVNRSDDFTMANLIAGTGALVNAGTGTTRLTGANTFTGGLTVSAGTVALERGAALADTNAVTVELNAILELTDSERMGALTNRGTVDLSSGNGRAGTVLTVNGNYTAASDLRMDVVLGGDASATDLMVVEGNTSGATNVVVVNQGGTGATTTTGIRLVDVQGTSDGSFVLANADMTLESGEAGISAGNYVYLLRQVAGDWFLQSQFQSFAVAYDALPSALLGMTQTASLMQRLAGRVPLTPASSGAPSVTASTSGGGGAAPTGLWFNLRAADADVTPAGSTTALSYGQSTWRLQAGYDLEVAATPNGTWVLGASAFRGGSELNATSAIGSGTINSDARGLGLTATWYGTSGVYTDIQLEYARFKTDVTSPVDGLLASDVDGSGRFASVEVGKAFALQNGLTLTPQAQLSWASVKMDSFIGSEGGAVTVGETDSLKLRLGLAAERGWTTATGESGRVYGIANVTREFRGDTSVSLDGDALTTDAVDVTGELGVGLSYDWQNAGKTSSLFGQVEVSRDLSGGDLTAVSGTAGLRIRW
jgi:fibronectin-binding autotransporter adhesin